MKILFNLAHQRNAFNILSANDIGIARAMLTKVCLDNGFPVSPGFYDRNLSFEHSAVYESVKDYAEHRLLGIPSCDVAVLTDLGNLQFQLSVHHNLSAPGSNNVQL
ncbi:putative CRISPR-associated endoribonuclease [Kosakonia phage Kc263]|uniref:CRISPR-associated endoribonuclease n=1 Tax=Kosakonia phage Kc263 TaxID=2863194 RepID=A0AAE7WFA6_9CAUD|nr:putative CRISPR-associated endoribonuclease [Kosakonia phage Kc263]QYN80039.1 putative CRISPR-associated endoribonuclease [Kosakonia phage Kc263]